MNRQGANYVESVGDPMPRPWQTKKHNITWLCIVSSVFVFAIVFFGFFNSTSLEEVTISLKEQNTQNFVEGSTIFLTYAHNGDFNFSENGNVTFSKHETCWKRFKSKSTCKLFAINGYNTDSIIANHTTTTLDLSAYKFPKASNMDSLKAISKNKEYIRYGDLQCDIKFKSALVPPSFRKKGPIESYKYVFADTYRFGDWKRWRIKDTIFCQDTIHLYAKKIIKPAYNEYISSFKTDDGKTAVKYVKHPEVITYVFADSKLHSQQLDLFSRSTWFQIMNRTCCNLFIRSIEFPCDENCKFVLSFSTPMYFDKLSIEPDAERPNEIVYSSPEKIKALKKSGLYVYARDVSVNNQEMINFCIATFLGVLISYIIEFSKRLYNAKKDEEYAARNGQ